MIPPLIAAAALQAAGPPDPAEARFDRCVAQVATDPAAATVEATRWAAADGGFVAQQCLGLALAKQDRFAPAAAAFEQAASLADAAKDGRSGTYRAQAGNAWLAAGDPAKARTALIAAIRGGTLRGIQLPEAMLDRGRAAVALGDLAAARVDIDRAVTDVPADPLAWLLSATLARRMNDLPRAARDIAKAEAIVGDEPSIALEAGNIAAAQGDAAEAKRQWSKAAAGPAETDPVRQARVALRQFDGAAAAKP